MRKQKATKGSKKKVPHPESEEQGSPRTPFVSPNPPDFTDEELIDFMVAEGVSPQPPPRKSKMKRPKKPVNPHGAEPYVPSPIAENATRTPSTKVSTFVVTCS